ncbi:hypothetical protein CALCODRAFT_501425 [Calocera cornea HHB12733]|uniref:ER transporter 6TM N-terminal domain-containing protein n=1 Tax=Calocera cornea HHB12733 TaxID=1353952 RepID=A0A165DLT5_9BASI|nr:hypothetical protein CALCODRAFT_501425 [Calocera cornea HHB12733]
MKFELKLPSFVSWIPGKINQWQLWKPAIRCAIVAWICWVLLLIVPVERTLGQASFFIIIVAIINPPSDPLAIFLDKTLGIFLFVGIGWAWGAIAYAIANAVRSGQEPLEAISRESSRFPGLQSSDPAAFLQQSIFDGVYLETKSSAVMATFLGVGVAIMTYLRSKLTPSFGQPTSSIFACIVMDVIMTYGALIPTYDAVLGNVFVIPMLVYTGVAILGSLLIFPETVQEQYCNRYIAVISQMKTIIEEQPKVLGTTPGTDEWSDWKKLKEQRETLGTLYGALDVSGSNLNREITWGRFSHNDLKDLQDSVRKLIVRIGGMTYFHRTVSEWLERKRLAEESRANSRAPSREHSREPSPTRETPEDRTAPAKEHSPAPDAASPAAYENGGHLDQSDSRPESSDNRLDHSNSHLGQDDSQLDLPPGDHLDIPSRRSRQSLSRINLRRLLNETFGDNLLTPSESISIPESGTSTPRGRKLGKDQQNDHHWFHWHSDHGSPRLHGPTPVGVFESMRYISVHTRFLVPGEMEDVERMHALLAEAADPLLNVCAEALESFVLFFEAVNHEKWWKMRHRKTWAALVKADLQKKEDIKEKLARTLESYKTKDRLHPIERYRHKALTPHTPYRGIFFISIYSFHLIDFANALLVLLEEVLDVEEKRTERKLWWPMITLSGFLGGGSRSDPNEMDDEDPDTIQGLQEFREPAEARDPDSEPPSNLFYYYGGKVQRGISNMFRRGDAFFAAKAGIITVIVAIPQYVQNSASFYYYHRGLWAIIMAQLTLQRWAGDTIIQWVWRIIATFCGAVLGVTLWYIGSGSSTGNAFGLGAVGAVALPIIFFLRLHSPYVVMYVLFSVTTFLILGYSRQDGVGGFSTVNSGWGWDVGWRRFLLVVIGITIAAIFALIPPETSRHSVRRTISKTIEKMGSIHAELLSYAGRTHSGPDVIIVDNLVRINAKLRTYLTLRISGAEYEPTLEGKWPAEKYRKLQATLLELSDLLGQLMTVFWRIGQPHIDKRWREGLVLRTRFLQPTFIGETMAVYYILATALKTASPLPQILPTPLVDRAFDKRYGLRVPQGSDPDAKRPHFGTGTPGGDTPTPGTPRGSTSAMRDPDDHPLAEKHVRLEEPTSAPPPTRMLDKQELTFDMVSDEGYMIFVTGVMTTYDLLTRLDRLVMVVRELVGEKYAIRGLDREALLSDYDA